MEKNNNQKNKSEEKEKKEEQTKKEQQNQEKSIYSEILIKGNPINNDNLIDLLTLMKEFAKILEAIPNIKEILNKIQAEENTMNKLFIVAEALKN